MHVDFNVTAALTKCAFLQHKAQQVLDSEILRTTEPFVPYAKGALTRSGPIHTVIGSGTIRWATPYARRRYYEDANLNKTTHRKATTRWYEAAREVYLEKWKMTVAKKIGAVVK
ncbi:MAG: minor capsid protein [Oscillospiraceae bacterium]|jgi:hypothetical protein|nr:minor capsid protein [Oscillospiraceae bacterium]